MASAASLKEQDSITVITEGVGSGPGLKNSNNQYDRECLEKGGSGSLNMEQGKSFICNQSNISLALRSTHYSYITI